MSNKIQCIVYEKKLINSMSFLILRKKSEGWETFYNECACFWVVRASPNPPLQQACLQSKTGCH